MTFKIKINHRGAVAYDYAKTEYLAKRKARKIVQTAEAMASNVVDIVYVEDCLGGLRAEFRVNENTQPNGA